MTRDDLIEKARAAALREFPDGITAEGEREWRRVPYANGYMDGYSARASEESLAENVRDLPKAHISGEGMSLSALAPTGDDREALRVALASVSDATPGCTVDGCQHEIGYLDSGDNDLCACHFSDALAHECDGQLGALRSTTERQIDAVLAAGFHRSEVPEPSAERSNAYRRQVLITPDRVGMSP